MKRAFAWFAVAATLTSASGIALAEPWPKRVISSGSLVGDAQLMENNADAHTALMGFSMRFLSGDRRVRALGFVPTSDRVSVSLSDKDGGEPFAFSATFATLINKTGVYPVAKKSGCVASCDVTIFPNGPTNDFVLKGFRFKTKNDVESHVKRIAIQPGASLDKVHVHFVGSTSPVFDVEIAYVRISRDISAGPATASGARKNGEPSIAITTPKAPAGTTALLQGFDIQFENGAHNLQELTIRRGVGRYEVRFNDQNTDDPYSVQIYYIPMLDG